MPRPKSPDIDALLPRPAVTCGDGAMSVAAAVAFTGISRSELWRLMAAGKLSYSKRGRIRVIPRKSLVALLAEGFVAGSR